MKSKVKKKKKSVNNSKNKKRKNTKKTINKKVTKNNQKNLNKDKNNKSKKTIQKSDVESHSKNNINKNNDKSNEINNNLKEVSEIKTLKNKSNKTNDVKKSNSVKTKKLEYSNIKLDDTKKTSEVKTLKNNIRLFNVIRYIIVFILIGIIIFCGYKLYVLGRDTIRNKIDSEKLRESVIINKPNTNEEKPNDEENKKPSIEDITIDFNTLLNTNKDTVGWIMFNNDLINNPVVHTSNNFYYLNHTFNKINSVVGTIFMDYRNNSFNDRNVVLFGHSNLDRSMFGSLNDVFKDGFFDREGADIIYIFDTNNNLLKYQIFSFYNINSEEYYITTHFNDQSFQVFLNTIKSRSYQNRNIEVTVNDKILTLSTCAGAEGTDRRRVIHAKRIN